MVQPLRQSVKAVDVDANVYADADDDVVLALNRRMDQPVKSEVLLEAVVEEPPALPQVQRLELQKLVVLLASV